ncbi:MAG: hypothetical protein JWM28_242 [Chitinophagaceae bacterium]|nr:hypothetical protein [Chitinophagaceae bacterium]
MTHISKDTFFYAIRERLFRYREAIWGHGSSPNIASFIHYNSEKMKYLEAHNSFLGNGFWGYGINSISDGKETYSHFDVEEIRKIPDLNKHHEPYRQLLVLTFKVEDDSLFVSTFSIETVTALINSNIKSRYDLKDFKNARILTRKNKSIVEFIFDGLEKPISFQVDDYYFPQDLSGDQLAKHYIDTIKKYAKEVKEKEQNMMNTRIFDFLKDFTTSIHLLQSQDVNAECIRALKEDGKKNESAFRYWFQTAFIMKGYSAEPEPEKGNGRIDLKVTHPSMANKIIEFKGWWNSDKKNIINQLQSYLTDFEKDGYVFMINHKKINIVKEYRELIVTPEMKYIPNSWSEIAIAPSDYTYFKSEHNFTRRKTIYHFIFSIY